MSIESISAQITKETIATYCQNDSGIPKENFLEYGEDLAKTLSQLSLEALARVLGTSQQVVLSPGDSLNDALNLANIEFPAFSSKLPTSAVGPLGAIAEFLVSNPLATIQVEGHVSIDYFGAQSLSDSRAEAAKNYLVELGIDPERIEAIGKGYTDPIEGGLQANQRIEFVLRTVDK